MTELKPINGKAIYTTKGAAREYGRIGCNFYKGCPHGCEYCYLKRGAPSAQLGGNVAELKKCFKDEQDALRRFAVECDKHIDAARQYGVFFSFSTDPMLPETHMLTLAATRMALERGIPVKILTKCATTSLMGNMVLADIPKEQRQMVAVGFTLTGRDDMEPNASTNHDRIEAMRRLHDLGFKTFASIEPVIDWQHARMVITLSLDCCDHYKIGLRSGVRKDYYDLVQSGMNLQSIVGEITGKRGKTVYLKESTRALLRRFLVPDGYDAFMSYTVDMDGKPYKRETTEH